MFCVRKAVTVLSLGLALSVCRNAHAAGVDVVFQQGSLGATAFFNTVDESGCISTRVFVIANADTERVLPAPRNARCAGRARDQPGRPVSKLSDSHGQRRVEEATIVVSPNLREASVTAVVRS
jgi:hypothetical protein